MCRPWQKCLALLVCAALSGLAACRSADRADSTAYFPLHRDDTWIYEIARGSKPEPARLTVRARGDQFVEPLRKRAHVVEERYADQASGPPGEPYLLAYYQDGGFVHRAMSLEYQGEAIVALGPHANEERFLPVGLDVRSRWNGTTTAYDVPGGSGYAVEQTHQAIPERETIEVPAGRFPDCIRVDTVAVQQIQEEGRKRGRPIIFSYRDWYAPNVGLVRSHLSTSADHQPVVAETTLISFVPGKASD
jgi:hypothetical protein